MNPPSQQPLGFVSPGDPHHQNPTNAGVWNQRPALEMVGSDELKNLERVLMMNWSTMQQQPQPQPQALGADSLQFNPYLLQMMQATQQSSPVPTIPVVQPSPPQPRHHQGSQGNAGRRNTTGNAPTAQQQQPQQQTFQPVIQYPFVPFWTACPLPFSPLAYPQIIMPPAAMAPQQIGPQLLRPINWQQMPMPNFQTQMPRAAGQPSQPSQPPTPQSTSTAVSTPASSAAAAHTPLLPQSTPGTPSLPQFFSASTSSIAAENKKSEYEEKLERYREKRMKRKWSRAPDQRLSQAAQSRPRDENGKFTTSDDKVVGMSSYEASQKAEYLQKQLEELKEQLSRSQYESKLLREKLVHTERELGVLKKTNQPTPKVIPDDMYQRQVITHAQMSQPGDLFAFAEDGTIYSPFKGGNALVDAFKEKVDFSQKKQDLRPINSPFLQAGKEHSLYTSIFDGPRMSGEGVERVEGERVDAERLEYERCSAQTQTMPSTEQWVEEFLLGTGGSSDEELDAMNFDRESLN